MGSASTRSIAPHDISVVVQGPLAGREAVVKACIASVRAVLPGAEVVLSTWTDEDARWADVDLLVRSDVAASLHDASGTCNNINLQRRSTLAGLRAATRSYALKLRNDCLMQDARMACIAPPPPPSALPLLCEPITISSLFLRNPARFPLLFHVSDTVQFGRRADLLDLWDAPETTIEALRCDADGFPRWRGNFLGYTDFREVPEQTLVLSWLRRRGHDVRLRFACELEFEAFALWERVLVGNFHLLDHADSGLLFPARMLLPIYGGDTVYRAAELQALSAGLHDADAQRARFLGAKRASGWGALRRKRYWISLASLSLFGISPRLGRWARRIALRGAGLPRTQ